MQTQLATMDGKEAALNALAERRECNKTREPIDNSKGYAGDPMHFGCIACNEDITVPENYITKPTLCGECKALKELGWLQ